MSCQPRFRLVTVFLLAFAQAIGQPAATLTYAQVTADIQAHIGKEVTWTGIEVTEQDVKVAGRTEYLYTFYLMPVVSPKTASRFWVRSTEPLPHRIGSILKVTGTLSGAHRDSKGNESPELKDPVVARRKLDIRAKPSGL